VTDTASIAPTITRIRQDMGEIDILACCAGSIQVCPAPQRILPEKVWDNILAVNTKGLFFCNQAVARQS